MTKTPNPKVEVSSSKIDEMVKVKNCGENAKSIDRFALGKFCYQQSTNRLSFCQEWSNFAETTKLRVAKIQETPMP